MPVLSNTTLAKKNPYCREGGIVYYRHFLKKKSLLSRGWYWIIPTFHFHLMTMIVPWAWLGGIADYHPHPSGLGNTHLLRRQASGGRRVLPQPLRIRRVFSNTSSPCSRYCYNSKSDLLLVTYILGIFISRLNDRIPKFCATSTKIRDIDGIVTLPLIAL